MNKINKIIITASLFVLTVSACKRPVYETEPIRTTYDLVFDVKDSLGVLAEDFLLNIYADMPAGYNRIGGDVLDAGTDDAMSSSPSSLVENFTNGRQSPLITLDDSWAQNYATIRKVNIFLANIDRVPHKNPLVIPYWKSEARALRAIAYFELIKRYGGVILIGDKIYELSDDLELPVNTFSDCVDYIVAECDAIIPNARPNLLSKTEDDDFGRITSGTLYALKARVLLYAASPLNNNANDVAKWAAAAKAAKDLIDLGEYGLEGSFLDIFITRKNKEVILANQDGDNTSLERRNAPIGYTGNVASSGRTSPTQELVDDFQMKNGKAITDPTSGYDSNNPYKNRDPRFYHTIFHNDMYWLDRKIETFEGGLDKPGSSVNVQTRTGYYMRKFLDDGWRSGKRPTVYSNQVHNFPIFRYAEVLLNYAEAQNEALAAPDASVYKAVEDIRKRAGLVPFALPANLSKAQMREVIRHERRVEMAFEEQRFWDLRRWKIAETVLNGTLHGMKILKTGSTFKYERVEVTSIQFDPLKMYHYPIPFSEINKNKNLKQPQGW